MTLATHLIFTNTKMNEDDILQTKNNFFDSIKTREMLEDGLRANENSQIISDDIILSARSDTISIHK